MSPGAHERPGRDRLRPAADRRPGPGSFRAGDGAARILMRIPWLPTALSYDCGPACLAMVLAHHGRDSSVDDIRARLGTSRDGTTGFELVRVARELGMEARGVKAADASALKDVPLPAIAHYRSGH